tara:strand:+ start:321 stop:659 length:339 start_codon:yes stop_codon:yes gene_type:complete
MRFFFLLSNEKGITLTIDKIYIMKHLINYGKHVDLHNNGREVYVDLHKVSNKQLDTGDENLWTITFEEPIKDFDRNKSYYRPPMTEDQKLMLEEVQASMHWKDEIHTIPYLP